MKRFSVIFPGLLLATIIFIISDFLSQYIGKNILGYPKSPISTVMFSIILGILIGNLFNIPSIFSAGLSFSLKFILRLGIVLLGIRLSFSDVALYGATSAALIVICIISVILIIYVMVHYFKISASMSYLIAIGTSICGASAIVATAPVINAKKAEVTYAIANITIFGIIGMFLYPYLANHLFQGDVNRIGLFLGTAIHETAQVAAAGLIYEQQFNDARVLEISTITKLVRNTFLIVMIPLFAYFYTRNSSNKHTSYSILNIFPLFVLGFLVMVIVRSVGDGLFINDHGVFSNDFWNHAIITMKSTSAVLLSIAMASLGVLTNLKEIRTMGYRPFLIGFVAASMIGLVSFLIISLFI
ncbi:MAG: putative sulfate exporter family transporter [Alphaproteobacteria bacterium]|nr:putative sulfate exporter family transporter [Alphaproteobacteria bacterium]